MKIGRAVFVVGHSNWGKSKTLRALTGGKYQVRHTSIDNVAFFIRRMSNDDLSDEYFEFVESLDPTERENVIAALCPEFDDLEAGTRKALDALKRQGYKLYFWVIKHRYGSAAMISDDEIRELQSYGLVEIYAKSSEAEQRAKAFKKFIVEAVLA